MNKIAIIQVNDESTEPSPCWRIDDESLGEQFFSFLQNYDEEYKPTIEFKFVTQEEWDEIDRIGKELA